MSFQFVFFWFPGVNESFKETPTANCQSNLVRINRFGVQPQASGWLANGVEAFYCERENLINEAPDWPQYRRENDQPYAVNHRCGFRTFASHSQVTSSSSRGGNLFKQTQIEKLLQNEAQESSLIKLNVNRIAHCLTQWIQWKIDWKISFLFIAQMTPFIASAHCDSFSTLVLSAWTHQPLTSGRIEKKVPQRGDAWRGKEVELEFDGLTAMNSSPFLAHKP